MRSPLFEIGNLYITPDALDFLEVEKVHVLGLVARHIIGDWGSVSLDDALANREALRKGSLRIFSSYAVANNFVWVITEADRSATTLLLPDNY